MSIFLILLGLLVNFVFGIVIIVKAFRVSVGWGLAVIFLPFASLLFVINNWQDTKTAFLGGLAGFALMILGVCAAPTPDPDDADTATRVASRSSRSSSDDDTPRNQASAAAPTSYTPPRNSYQPTSYSPAYPPPAPAPAPTVTETQANEDEWTRGKPKLEQVYVDRATDQFYAEKCKKRPENVYRLPRSVALMQGFTEAACK